MWRAVLHPENGHFPSWCLTVFSADVWVSELIREDQSLSVCRESRRSSFPSVMSSLVFSPTVLLLSIYSVSLGLSSTVPSVSVISSNPFIVASVQPGDFNCVGKKLRLTRQKSWQEERSAEDESAFDEYAARREQQAHREVVSAHTVSMELNNTITTRGSRQGGADGGDGSEPASNQVETSRQTDELQSSRGNLHNQVLITHTHTYRGKTNPKVQNSNMWSNKWRAKKDTKEKQKLMSNQRTNQEHRTTTDTQTEREAAGSTRG